MLSEKIKKQISHIRVKLHIGTRLRYYRDTFGLKSWTDRQKGHEKLLIILAGYKPFCYSHVFDRVKTFTPDDIDICVVSSGLYDEDLAKIAETNGWSYLTTSRDRVPLPLNLAILKHPKAKYIYKMDEDIFLTDGCFDSMMKTYHKVIEEGYYDVGFVAPLIPVNGYGHTRVLQKLDLVDLYESRYGKMKCHAFAKCVFDPELTKFLWGEGGHVPHLDDLNRLFAGGGGVEYTICPIRFSVGMILFHRDIWDKISMFDVPLGGNGMGCEEAQLCASSINDSRIIAVSDSTAVGHLSFGPCTDAMKEYLVSHEEHFAIKRG